MHCRCTRDIPLYIYPQATPPAQELAFVKISRRCTVSGNISLCYSCVTLELDPLTFRFAVWYHAFSLNEGPTAERMAYVPMNRKKVLKFKRK